MTTADGKVPTGDSSELGIEAVKAFMKEIGVAEDGIIQHDGSGLSRHDLITPEAVVQLYTYMAKQSPIFAGMARFAHDRRCRRDSCGTGSPERELPETSAARLEL
jgi:hypothetical protein